MQVGRCAIRHPFPKGAVTVEHRDPQRRTGQARELHCDHRSGESAADDTDVDCATGEPLRISLRMTMSSRQFPLRKTTSCWSFLPSATVFRIAVP